MKHTIFACLLTAAVAATACGGGKKDDTPAATPPGNNQPAAKSDDPYSDPVYTEGLNLVKSSDCLTCHRESQKINGPTYEEVAAKYDNTPENVAMLAENIIKGVTVEKSKWNSTVAMTAHPALSKEDAEKIVKYIFKLKK